MSYYLMNGNRKVLEFEHELTALGDRYVLIGEYRMDELPVGFPDVSNVSLGLSEWIRRRTIPVNRHHMEAVLGAINLENPFDIVCYSHGMSLNDTFWVQEVSEQLDFDSINLYENEFDASLGWIAFTGLSSSISRHLSSPELTTGGMLPKYWQRLAKSNVVMCKGGTDGYSNAGLEPFAEVVAYLIAKRIRVLTIPYWLERRNKAPVSLSRLFTSRATGLLPAERYLTHRFPQLSTIPLEYALSQMRDDEISLLPFYEMCLLDFLIENGDRHLNNWGFSIDNGTQAISGFAPLWDNGASLYYERDSEMRRHFNFASFSIPYEFVKECEFREDFVNRCNILVHAINDRSLAEECLEAVKGFDRFSERVVPALEFVRKNCENYIEGKVEIRSVPRIGRLSAF